MQSPGVHGDWVMNLPVKQLLVLCDDPFTGNAGDRTHDVNCLPKRLYPLAKR